MANVDVGLPVPLGNYSYLPPVQTGVNDVVEEKAMNPLLGWLAGQGIDLVAEKTGVKDVFRERGAGLLDLVGLGKVQASDVQNNTPVQTGFQPTTSVVAQDVVGTPIPETIPNPSYVPDSAIPMEGRRLPTGGQTLIRQDWQGPGRGVAPGGALPDGTIPANMDGEMQSQVQARVMRDAQKLANMGLTTPQQVAAAAAKESNTAEKDNTPPPEGGVLSTLGDYFKSEEAMSYLVMGLNSLRSRPDQGIAQTLGKRIETLRGNRQANRTAEVLLQRGIITADQAEMIRMGLTEQAFGTDKFSRILEMMKTPEGMAKLQQLKEIGALGAPTVQIGGEQQTELDKMLGKKLGEKVSADFDAGTQARQALDSLDTLMGLSEGLDTATSIPPALRGLVPEGVSDPLDAYRGVMTNVAKSLRIKGEGTMSDRDIDLLIRQAGPATSNLQARRIMQQTLKNKAQINLELSKLANQFLLGNMSREQYLEQVNVLNNTPAMNEEMRRYISALGGDQKLFL